ncbi:MAG: amidohydrolase family protein [Opitutaceae bacterium]|nr:amidohydrolase family protein [Opitutaceae bacterium]
MKTSLDYTAHDRQIWEEELDAFVPRRIFDAHAHLFWHTHVPAGHPGRQVWCDADHAAHLRWAQRLYPHREVHFLYLGTPVTGIHVGRHNLFLRRQTQRDPRSRVNLLVTPACRIETIAAAVRHRGVIGLKPYRLFSRNGNPDTCRIHEFFTEPQLELANDLGLWVTMHLSRYWAAADPDNLRDLQEYTRRRYPRIKWILAHCARSFTYWPIRESIEKLRDLPNLYYDLSAVCDVRPFITLFRRENHRRIFWGSDGITPTFFRGGYFALGRSWVGIGPGDLERKQFAHCDGRPILAVYENLLAVKQAAEIAGYTRAQVEAIFWGNAEREFLRRQ